MVGLWILGTRASLCGADQTLEPSHFSCSRVGTCFPLILHCLYPIFLLLICISQHVGCGCAMSVAFCICFRPTPYSHHYQIKCCLYCFEIDLITATYQGTFRSFPLVRYSVQTHGSVRCTAVLALYQGSGQMPPGGRSPGGRLRCALMIVSENEAASGAIVF